MKRILLCLLCAALLTGCGKETAPAVAAAQRYQPIVQAVGDGTSAGVDLTDAQIAQAVARLSDAGLTAVHVDASEPVTHPEAVTAFWDARAAGETAEIVLYEVCRDGGLLCHALRFTAVPIPSRARALSGAMGRFPSAMPIPTPSRP